MTFDRLDYMSAKSQNTTYPAGFFSRLQHGAKRSAETIVPLVLELVRVESVLDVGCGTGAWLSVFMQHGVRDVVGVDGDYVDGEMLEIPAPHFIAADLNNPLDLDATVRSCRCVGSRRAST